MNIQSCNNMSGFKTFTSNGFTIHVDSYSSNLMSQLSPVTDSDGNALTYRECIDHATKEARARLLSRTDNDKPFELALSKVPLKIMKGAEGGEEPSHFAYSGSCAKGCVYTHLPERLIRDIAESPDLLVHEYAHVLHMSIPSSPQAKAQLVAWENFVSVTFPVLETTYPEQPYDPDGCCFWYARRNEFEYFAVTTQAYFIEPGMPERWDWPKSTSLLASQDPEGHNATARLWATPEADLIEHMSKCKIPWMDTVDPADVITVAAIILSGLAIGVCVLCRKSGVANGSRRAREKGLEMP
jgi:hypothetical protein